MERSAWPKNLSSSRKREIEEVLNGQNPTKKIRQLFDAHSQTGNNTAQPLIAEDLVVNVLGSFSNTLSLSSSAAESYEVLQVPTNACVRSEVSEGSESIKPPPVPSESIHFPVPRSYFRWTYKIDQGCQATKQVQKINDDPPVYMTIYQGHHTCLAGTSYLNCARSCWTHQALAPRYSSIPLSFNTSLIAEQEDDDNSIFINFQSASSVGDIKSRPPDQGM